VPLPVTVACAHYDRTEALRDGRVVPEGVELTYLDLPVEETFFRMARSAASSPPSSATTGSWRCPSSRRACSGTARST
jgi:hypothetical protein